MSELHLPFLQLSVVIPIVGAALLARINDSHAARKWSVLFQVLTLISAGGAWIDFAVVGATEAHDPWDFAQWLSGRPLLVIDEISAPLLPMVGLLFLLTALVTLRTKIRRFSFALSLLSEAVRLATFGCKTPWGVIVLLAIGTISPWLELRSRRKSTRIYVFHMLSYVILMILGWSFVQAEGEGQVHSWWAIAPLLAAVVIGSGMIPMHCWMTDLFEKATFGRALLYVTPLTGAYAAVRLVLPVAPESIMQGMGLISLATVVYAAGMALVQREARRFFCYLFLSHSALVLVGLEVVNPIGLTGAMCLWLSIGVSLTGFGLTLRALESRFGRLSLNEFHGLYEHTPALAVCFALTGLASVGFPGTLGFVGTEMLIDGAVEAYPHVGVALVVAAVLNGIAIVRAYFSLFTGTRHVSSISLGIGIRERLAVLTLAILMLGGGLFPQPGVASRFHAAQVILRERTQRHLDDESTEDDVSTEEVHAALTDF